MAAMSRYVVALFGEAEKGQFRKAYFIHELAQLMELLGNPPPESQGIAFGIQSLLFKRELIYFRVEEEGFSVSDYLLGLRDLEDQKKIKNLHAICLPGAGEKRIMGASEKVCRLRGSILLLTQKDLYDYLTA